MSIDTLNYLIVLKYRISPDTKVKTNKFRMPYIYYIGTTPARFQIAFIEAVRGLRMSLTFIPITPPRRNVCKVKKRKFSTSWYAFYCTWFPLDGIVLI